jgi:hypothetical protein
VVDPGGGTNPTDVAGLVTKASTLFDQAQTALKAGDFATYGVRIAELQAVLKELAALTENSAP